LLNIGHERKQLLQMRGKFPLIIQTGKYTEGGGCRGGV
jgi:hypothetical protein